MENLDRASGQLEQLERLLGHREATINCPSKLVPQVRAFRKQSTLTPHVTVVAHQLLGGTLTTAQSRF